MYIYKIKIKVPFFQLRIKRLTLDELNVNDSKYHEGNNAKT